MEKKVTLKILRGEASDQYWEEFQLPLPPRANVISLLMDIQQSPITCAGKKVAPVAWEQGCLEEVCGSCSMLINGKPRQACTAVIEPILEKSGSSTITLAPLSKFPLVRDLFVDRTGMFENLKRVNAWVEADGSFLSGFGPNISQEVQDTMYVLSTCMTCGCCSESCPQVNAHSKYIGPAPISQARFFNLNPTGHLTKAARLHALMDEGGVSECGNSQNCVQVCPKKIPLTESLAVMGRDVSREALKSFFSLPERD